MASDITVVIPAYNAASTIGRALDSIQRQTCRPHEVIVVDDGSTDATARVVKGHPLACRLIRTRNSGVSAARNTGIQAATTGHVALLDADDEFYATHLEALTQAMAAHPDAALYWAGMTRVFAAGAERERGTLPDASAISRKHAIAGTNIMEIGPSAYDDMIRGNFITPSASMFKRRVAGSVVEFDTKLKLGEDRVFFLKMLGAGKSIFIDQATAIVHRDGSNASVTFDRSKLLGMAEKTLITLAEVGKLDAVRSHPGRLSIVRQCVASALRQRIYYASFTGLRPTIAAIGRSIKAQEFQLASNLPLIAKSIVRAVRQRAPKSASRVDLRQTTG